MVTWKQSLWKWHNRNNTRWLMAPLAGCALGPATRLSTGNFFLKSLKYAYSWYDREKRHCWQNWLSRRGPSAQGSSRAPSAGEQALCWSLPSLEPVRSAFGPVFGVYFVSLVAVLCFVQSKLSVSSWVKRQMLPSSNPQWNSPANAANEQKFRCGNYSSYACLSKYLLIIPNTLWDDAY